MSILFPDSGELSVLGQRSALEAKDRIGYLPEERGVYRKMKVGAFLIYMAQLKGMRRDAAAAVVPKMLESMNLPGTENKPCEDLSKGMLQRVQFIAAVIHQPDLLILDEPFSGQDPVSVRLLREHIVREHRRGATVLLSTHVMANAEEMCQHVVMIHQGHKVLDEPVAGLRRQFDRADHSFRAARSWRGSVAASGGARRRARRGGGRRLHRAARRRHRSGGGDRAAGGGGAAGACGARPASSRGRVHQDRLGRRERAAMRLAPCAPGCRRRDAEGAFA